MLIKFDTLTFYECIFPSDAQTELILLNLFYFLNHVPVSVFLSWSFLT